MRRRPRPLLPEVVCFVSQTSLRKKSGAHLLFLALYWASAAEEKLLRAMAAWRLRSEGVTTVRDKRHVSAGGETAGGGETSSCRAAGLG